MTALTPKQTLRQRILAAREQLPVALRAEFSTAIAQHIAQMPGYRTAQTVFAYMNFGAEFESEIFVRQALKDGKVLLLPKVNAATRELELFRIEDLDAQLAPGAYGIREPVAGCAEAHPGEAEFILLPGVAFGRGGERLGYGGGFYDKLLSRMTHRPLLAAGAFSMQIVPDIPMEIFDRRVDWLVTENETLRCAG